MQPAPLNKHRPSQVLDKVYIDTTNVDDDLVRCLSNLRPSLITPT